jgi:hypothetical protein
MYPADDFATGIGQTLGADEPLADQPRPGVVADAAGALVLQQDFEAGAGDPERLGDLALVTGRVGGERSHFRRSKDDPRGLWVVDFDRFCTSPRRRTASSAALRCKG